MARELYLALVLDRASQRVAILASAEGGREVEEIAATRPESLIRATVDPAVGLQDYQCREIGFALGLGASVIQDFAAHQVRSGAATAPSAPMTRR